MSNEIPGVTILAIVLTNRSPLTLAQIRPPLLPFGYAFASFFETCVLGAHQSILYLSHSKSFRGLQLSRKCVVVRRYKLKLR